MLHSWLSKRAIRGLFLVVGLIAGQTLFAQVDSTADSQAIALVGGKICTQTDAGVVVGTVLIRSGKIAAVGPNVTIPADARRIDVTGMVVTPGLIDARSSLWLTSDASRDSASDGGLNILDTVDPHQDDWLEVVRHGITAVYVQPASNGLLSGKGAVLKVGPGGSVEELVLKSPAAAQASLAPAAAAPAAAPQAAFPRRFGGGDPTPAEPAQPTASSSGNSLTRYGQYESLKRILEGGKKYDEDWKKIEDAEKASKAKGGEEKKSTSKQKRDPSKEFLRLVVRGELPLRLEANRDDDIVNALRLEEQLKIRIVIDGARQAKAVVEELKKRNIPLVLGPFLDSDESQGGGAKAGRASYKALLASGNPIAIATFSANPRGSRFLRAHAALAVANGLAPDRALRAITRDAAEMLGIGDRVGCIAPGKLADLAVFRGDPLDPSVATRLVMSSGRILQDASGPAVAAPASTGPTNLPARLPARYIVRSRNGLKADGSFGPIALQVENGKVARLDPRTTGAAGIAEFDLGTAVLTPGLVAVPGPGGLGGVTDDPAEADAAQVRAADAFDQNHASVRDLRNAGFTCAILSPGSANVIAGVCGGARLGAAEWRLADSGMLFSLAVGSRTAGRASADSSEEFVQTITGRGRSPSRYPASLAGQVELIEQVLKGNSRATDLYAPNLVRQQLQVERRRGIAGLLEKKQVALIEAHSRAEVDAALRLIDRFSLRGVLIGPVEVKPFLAEFKRLGVGIVAHNARSGDYDRLAGEIVAAAEAGIPVAFGSGTALEMRLTAAMACQAGMRPEIALQGLTTVAARIGGLSSSVGSFTEGSPADFVVWDGSPLDLQRRPLFVVVDGKQIAGVRGP